MLKKIIGWLLLAFGVITIVWGIWSSYQIFTAEKQAPEIFKSEIQQKTISLKNGEKLSQGTQAAAQAQIQEQLQQTIKDEIEKMLPSGSMIKFFNLIAWSIFIGILVFAGGKISLLGIKLLGK